MNSIQSNVDGRRYTLSRALTHAQNYKMGDDDVVIQAFTAMGEEALTCDCVRCSLRLCTTRSAEQFCTPHQSILIEYFYACMCGVSWSRTWLMLRLQALHSASSHRSQQQPLVLQCFPLRGDTTISIHSLARKQTYYSIYLFVPGALLLQFTYSLARRVR